MRQSGGNQAVNLSGMLSSIADTLGSGFEINGESAGVALGNNIREAAKPELDMKDPASIRKYAEWQGRNGKEKESMMMLEKASEVEDNISYSNSMAGISQDSSSGYLASENGEVMYLDKKIEALYAKADAAFKSGNADVGLAAKEAADSLSTRRGGAQQKQLQGQSMQLHEIRRSLKTGEYKGKKITPDEEKALNAQKDMLEKTKPAVVMKANELAVEEAGNAIAQEDAEWLMFGSKAAIAGFKEGKTTDELIKKFPELSKHRSRIEQEEVRYLKNKDDLAALLEAAASRDKKLNIAPFRKRIDEIKKRDPTAIDQALLDQVTTIETGLVNGKAQVGDKNRMLESISRLDSELTRVENMLYDEERIESQASRQVAAKQSERLGLSIDQNLIPPEFIAEAEGQIMAGGRYSEEWEDADGDEATEAGLVRQLAQENLKQAHRRLEIKANRADYEPLRKEDIDLFNKQIGETPTSEAEEQIEAIAEDMLRDNHDPAEVAELVKISKAEAEVLMLKIEEDDKRRAALSQTSGDSVPAVTPPPAPAPARNATLSSRVSDSLAQGRENIQAITGLFSGPGYVPESVRQRKEESTQ